MARMSFKDILTEKMSEAKNHSTANSSFHAQESEPLHLGYLYSLMNPLKTPVAPLRYKILTPTIEQRTPHQFNAEQSQAFQWFFDMGVDLDRGFYLSELKVAYRKLALRLHPDQTKTTDSTQFMLLLKMHKTLLGVFSK